VSDVLDRRTQSSFRAARAAADAAVGVAELIGPELGWDGERIHAEAGAYATEVRGRLTRAGLDPVPDGGATGEPTVPATVSTTATTANPGAGAGAGAGAVSGSGDGGGGAVES
jgi:hypothetical protein